MFGFAQGGKKGRGPKARGERKTLDKSQAGAETVFSKRQAGARAQPDANKERALTSLFLHTFSVNSPAALVGSEPLRQGMLYFLACRDFSFRALRGSSCACQAALGSEPTRSETQRHVHVLQRFGRADGHR